jgi:two-component system KDP operon response regulator KdpE
VGWAEVIMKILVVDADTTVSEGVATALQLQWHDAKILTATAGEAGLRQFFDHDPDIVLLEVELSDMSGIDVLRQIRRVSDVPILIYSVRADDIVQVRALEVGADEYVTKPCSYLVLIARIKAVLRRAELLPPSRALPDLVVGDVLINFRDRRVTVRGQPVKLTPVEYKLLYHLVRNAGRLMPHDALLDRVWGAEYGHTPDHLKVFISRLRSKIEYPGGPHYIETERGVGYSFVHPNVWRPTAPPPPARPRDHADRLGFDGAHVPALAAS